jgi:hypothetical protein
VVAMRTDHQHSIDKIGEARAALMEARAHLGNDHPAYGLLGHMIDHTFEVEGRFS